MMGPRQAGQRPEVEGPPRRHWPSAQERAWVYGEQLAEVKNERLRAEFLEMISDLDPAARKLMK